MSKNKVAKGGKTLKRKLMPYRKGVGAVVVNDTGQVLVCRRNDTERAAWQLPQGGIDREDEPLVEALRRELAEEIGTDDVDILAESQGWFLYDLPDELVGKVWKGRYRGQMQKWYLVRLNQGEASINLNTTDHPEFDSWQWVALRDIPALIVAFKQPIYHEIVQAFQDHPAVNA